MSAKRLFVFVIIFSLTFGTVFLAGPAFAQDLTPEQRSALQNEYDQTMKEISALQGTIDGLKQQQKSIKGDISLLTAQINQAEAVLKQKNILIQQLTVQINAKTQKINTLVSRIDQGKMSLAELIRKTREIDTYSLSEAVLSNKKIGRAHV